jgi:hypothetical protein
MATAAKVKANRPRKIRSGTQRAAQEPRVMPGKEPINKLPNSIQFNEPNHQCPIAAMAVKGTA